MLCGFSSHMATSVYRLASGNSNSPQIQANCSKIQELMDCILRNISCSITRDIIADQNIGKRFTTYSSVFAFDRSASIFAQFISKFMANATATSRTDSCTNDSDCKVFVNN